MAKTMKHRRKRSLLGRLVPVLVAGGAWLGAPSMGHAGTDLLSSAFNTDMLGGSSVEAIRDDDMQELRGGYRQAVAFGVLMYTDVGQLTGDSAGSDLPNNFNVSYGADSVSVLTSVGGLNGANGVFQFATVNGDMNVVNQNLTVNIYTLPAGSTGPASLLPTIAPPGGG